MIMKRLTKIVIKSFIHPILTNTLCRFIHLEGFLKRDLGEFLHSFVRPFLLGRTRNRKRLHLEEENLYL